MYNNCLSVFTENYTLTKNTNNDLIKPFCIVF
jgi:hypothetical protein